MKTAKRILFVAGVLGTLASCQNYSGNFLKRKYLHLKNLEQIENIAENIENENSTTGIDYENEESQNIFDYLNSESVEEGSGTVSDTGGPKSETSADQAETVSETTKIEIQETGERCEIKTESQIEKVDPKEGKHPKSAIMIFAWITLIAGLVLVPVGVLIFMLTFNPYGGFGDGGAYVVLADILMFPISFLSALIGKEMKIVEQKEHPETGDSEKQEKQNVKDNIVLAMSGVITFMIAFLLIYSYTH